MRRVIVAVILTLLLTAVGAAAWRIWPTVWSFITDDGIDADPDRLASVEGHLLTIRSELDAIPTFSDAARISANSYSCRLESGSVAQPKVWRNWEFTDATVADGEQKVIAELQRQGWEKTGSDGELKTVRSGWSATAVISLFRLDGEANDHVGVDVVTIDGREPCRLGDAENPT